MRQLRSAASSLGGMPLAAPTQATPGALGLSSFNKSHNPLPDTVVVDPGEKRLKRMRFTVCRAATLLQEETKARKLKRRVAMLTLTYRQGVDWEPGHISALIRHLDMYARRHLGGPVPIVWVAELTKAGRVHYHLALWLPRGRTLPKPDSQGWWQHGMTRIEWARFAPGYLAKYATKGSEGDFPAGLRLYGLCGLPRGIRGQLAFEKLPAWTKDEAKATPAHGLVRAERGGGFIVQALDGQRLHSPWAVVAVSKAGVRITRVGTVFPLAPVESFLVPSAPH